MVKPYYKTELGNYYEGYEIGKEPRKPKNKQLLENIKVSHNQMIKTHQTKIKKHHTEVECN